MKALKNKVKIEQISNEEDAAITKSALIDPDAQPVSDEQWDRAVPFKKLGRPFAEKTAERISLAVDPDVLAAYRARGKGWQTTMNKVLADWIKAQ